MSLMQKLLVTILSLTSFALADDAKVISFLKNRIGMNPNIETLNVKIVDKIKIEKPKGWEAYIIQLDGKAKSDKGPQPFSQRSIYFVGDGMMASEIYDLSTGAKLNASISPEFKAKYYDDEHLLFGNKDAAHKVVIFSDPLCPFCRSFVPEALSYMKQYPKTFAVYYYHFPLQSLHPAAVPLVQAAYIAESQGKKGVVEALYKVQVDGREQNIQKILDAFNKAQGTKLTVANLANPMAKKHLEHDLSVAQEQLVSGTPTVFFDGKKDVTKMQYKAVKLIK